MKYFVKSLGVIKNAEIEVRPITVFIGQNNSNKTWAAYGLYGLASQLSRSKISTPNSMMLRVDQQIKNIIDEFVGNVSSNTSALIRDTSLEQVKDNPASTLAFGVTRAESLEKLDYPLQFTLGTEELGKLLAIPDRDLNNAEVTLQLEKSEFENSPVQSMELIYNLERGAIDYYFFLNDKKRLGPFRNLRRTIGSQSTDDALNKIVENAFRHFFLSCFNTATAFPAERKALVSNYFMNSFRYQSIRMLEREAPLPIKDFIEMVQRAEVVQDFVDDDGEFVELAEMLEQKILKGKVGFQPSDDDQTSSVQPRRPSRGRLHFSPSDNVELRMHASASIVRSLAGLDIYLRTFCRPGDFIVVDEPEMNAHPEAQLIIMELLTALANKGVAVIITTHSPYLADHLNNLIEASKLSPEQQHEIAKEFKLKSKDSFIIQDRVSTYYFTESGSVSDAFDRVHGLIDLTSFSNESNYVTNLFSKIIQAGEVKGCDTNN